MREAAHDRGGERGRHPIARRRPELASQHARSDRRQIVPWERETAVDTPVERHCERELIGRWAHRFTPKLLRRHVRRRAEQRSLLREADVEERHGTDLSVGSSPDARAPRQAEVDHTHASVAPDKHVVRLEVAVDHAGRVGRLEAAARFEKERDDLAPSPLLRTKPL